MIRINVSDDGAGIDPVDLGRGVDPLFTTAPSRNSTAPGMHVVHNLMTSKLTLTHIPQGHRIDARRERYVGALTR